MIIFVAYSGRVAVGYSRNLRKAKDIGHDKNADEIREMHISDVKDENRVEVVRKWRKRIWSRQFLEVT